LSYISVTKQHITYSWLPRHHSWPHCRWQFPHQCNKATQLTKAANDALIWENYHHLRNKTVSARSSALVQNQSLPDHISDVTQQRPSQSKSAQKLISCMCCISK